MTTVATKDIYFSHSKIRGQFTGCSKTIESSYREVLENRDVLNRIPKIKVLFDGERYISENNRRLYLFKMLEIDRLEVRLEILEGKKLEKYKGRTFSKTAHVV
jgi:hypothetical protein